MNPTTLFASFARRPAPSIARALFLGSFLCGAWVSGCASNKKPASARDRDTLVPQDTQREAEQNYGQQEAFGNQLNMTTSEQAGAAHDAAVERARDPAGENRKKK